MTSARERGSGESILRPSPWMLESFFELLERRYAELAPGEHWSLGVQERLRSEQLVRLSGEWSLFRLREGLRCLLVRSEAQSRAFELAFAEAFPASQDPSALRKPYTGETLAENLARLGIEPEELRPESGLLHSPGVSQPRIRVRARWWWGVVAAACLVLGVATVAWLVPRSASTVTTAPSSQVEEPAQPAPTATRRDPSQDLLDAFRGVPRPLPPRVESSHEYFWWVAAGLGLMGLAVVWLRARSLKLPAPCPPVLRLETSRAGLVVQPPEAVPASACLAPDLLDRLAEAVGLALDPDAAPQLDVSLTVEATVQHAGIPQLVFGRPKRVRRLLVLWDRASPCLEHRPIHQELVKGLGARGIPADEATYDRDVHWVRYRGHTQATSAVRAVEYESDSVVLIVGEPELLTDVVESLRVLARFRRLAWVHPRDPAMWGGEAWQAARRVPLFAANRQGLADIARWATRGTITPGTEAWSPSWQPLWHQELAPRVPALSQREIEQLEGYLGPALPWAAALSACPVPFSLRYAEWVRKQLGQSDPFLAFRPESMHLDRLRPLCGAHGSGWTFDISVRHALWWQILASRWPELHAAVLELHQDALARLDLESRSAADLERDAAQALLAWVALSSSDLCRELDPQAREQQITDAARRVRDIRAKGRRSRWLSEWLGATTSAASAPFVLPRVRLERHWGAATRRWVSAAEQGRDPVLLSRLQIGAMLGFGALFLAGLGAATVGRETGALRVTTEGLDHVTSVELADDGQTLFVRSQGWVFPLEIPSRTRSVKVLPPQQDADPQQEGCIDVDTFPNALALRCTPGWLGRGLPGTSVALTLDIDSHPFRGDADRVRVARWLLASGSVDVVLIAPSGGYVYDGPSSISPALAHSIIAAQLAVGLPTFSASEPPQGPHFYRFLVPFEPELDRERFHLSQLERHGQPGNIADKLQWLQSVVAPSYAETTHLLPYVQQAFVLPDPRSPVLKQLVAHSDPADVFQTEVQGVTVRWRAYPAVRMTIRCEAEDCKWFGWFETELDAEGKRREPDVEGSHGQQPYLARGPWHLVVGDAGGSWDEEATGKPTKRDTSSAQEGDVWLLSAVAESVQPPPDESTSEKTIAQHEPTVQKPVRSEPTQTPSAVTVPALGYEEEREGQVWGDTDETRKWGVPDE